MKHVALRGLDMAAETHTHQRRLDATGQPAGGARASTMRLTCLRKGRDSERYVVSSQPAGRRLLRCACPVLRSTSTYGPWRARQPSCSMTQKHRALRSQLKHAIPSSSHYTNAANWLGRHPVFDLGWALLQVHGEYCTPERPSQPPDAALADPRQHRTRRPCSRVSHLRHQRLQLAQHVLAGRAA